METEVGAIAEGQQILSGDDVMEAQFKLQEATENGEPAQKLYLKTFQPIDRDMQIWQARPESERPLLATNLANRIIMYPIHANPHTKRYLKPKHGRFTTVIYEDGARSDLPSDPQDAAAHVALRLASSIFDLPGDGLGLIKDLDRFGGSCRWYSRQTFLPLGKKQRCAWMGARCLSAKVNWTACAAPSTGPRPVGEA